MNHELTVTVAGSSISVTIASNASTVEAYLRSLKTPSDTKLVVGLDVEWNSSGGADAKTALLQLCTGTKALIVQMPYLDFIPQALKEFLANSNVSFVGVGITTDVSRLARDYGLRCQNPVELGAQLANNLGVGLAELARNSLGLNIEKASSVARSNWAASVLTHEQIVYAVTDAFVGYLLGVKLLGGN